MEQTVRCMHTYIKHYCWALLNSVLHYFKIVKPKHTLAYMRMFANLPSHKMTISAVRNVSNTKLQTINTIFKYMGTNTLTACVCVCCVCACVFIYVCLRMLCMFSSVYAFTAYFNLLAFYTSFDLTVILFFVQHFTIRKGSTSVV